jgi:two-component system chemotaxis response regulator CheY
MDEIRGLYEMLRVLVVDDHMLMRTLMNNNLETMGFQRIDSAASGEEAIEKIEQSKKDGDIYNIVFLDWHMPGLEGIDVLKTCRADSDLDRMAIMMLTAEQEEKSILYAIQEGVTSYMVKPPSEETLTAKIEGVMDWLRKKGVKLQKSKPKKHARPDSKFVDFDKALPKTKPKLSNQDIEDLKDLVSKGVGRIFSDLFHVEMLPYPTDGEQDPAKDSESVVSVGRFKKDDNHIVLRLVFSKGFLTPLLVDVYKKEISINGKEYKDAGKEIINILCGEVKAFLGKGYMDVEFCRPGDDIEDVIDTRELNESSIINLVLTVNDSNNYNVEVAE